MKFRLNIGRPLSKPKYYLITDSEQSTERERRKAPWEGIEIKLKLFAYKQSEERIFIFFLMTYLLHNESAS